MKNVVVIVLVFVASVTVHWYLFDQEIAHRDRESVEVKEQIATYPFLSPRILQEYHNDTLINFLPLRKELRNITSPYQDSISLYFEYLPTGASIGINEKTEFTPASLLKLPVVMSYFHAKERLNQSQDPVVTILERDIDNRFGELWKRGAGGKIQLSEAAELAIKDSDNTAVSVLAESVPDEDFDAIYEGLDLDRRSSESGGIVFTAKHYTSVLKALYFSSVLQKDNSQLILEMLTETKFTDKLPAGVPKSVPVAHKVGVLGDMLYSDCGIVYVPKRPYVLCMISKGVEKDARSRMKSISQTIYTFVSTVNK